MVVRAPTVPTNARIAIKAIMAIKTMPFNARIAIKAIMAIKTMPFFVPARHPRLPSVGQGSGGYVLISYQTSLIAVLNSHLIYLSGMGVNEKLWKPLNKGINTL